MQTPQISIIVPIYNVSSYLKECLQSIVGQSYKNLDIILVDDGSSDESLNIALDFAKKDERIFVVSKPNGGQATARNFGLEFIKGSALREFFDFCHTERSEVSHIQSLTQTNSFEKATKSLLPNDILARFTQIQPNFIKSDLERINDFIIQELPHNTLIHFVDSDDFIEHNCIELCVKNLLEKGLDIVVHNLKEFDENTKEFKNGSYLNKLKQNSYDTGLELLVHNKIYDFYFSPQGLFRANILNRYALRYTEGIYHEDHDFGTLLFCLANKVEYINEPLYIYRQRANSTMSGQKNTAFPNKLPSFLEPLRKDFKDYKSLRAYFKAYCFVVVGFKIWEFFMQKSKKYDYHKIDKRERQYFDKEIRSYIKPYIDDCYDCENFYVPKAKEFMATMGYGNIIFWHFYFLVRSYFRNPKKNLELFGLRRKDAKS